jgi:hypothetical protein
MNDNDLEQRLRSETGPREEGYRVLELPPWLDPVATTERTARVRRTVLLIPAALAGALAVAVVAALLTPRTPVTPGHVGSASPTAGGSVTGDLPACEAQDLSFSAEAWGGAAGSRGTVVTVVLAEGRQACALFPWLRARVTDGNGTVLVVAERPSIPSIEPTSMNAGEDHTIGIAWSNWCGDEPQLPVLLSVEVGTQWVVVPSPEGGADPVPPCFGENQPTRLSVTFLQLPPAD